VKLNLDVSTTASRAQLSQEYIPFFQFRVPEITEQTIAIFWVIIARTIMNWQISAACLVVALPLFFIATVYNRKVAPVEKELHDKFEGVYNQFAKNDPQNAKSTRGPRRSSALILIHYRLSY